ncbi:hypothetical protein AQI88_01535 [Streptomyces cellostaticus]|uniref:Uncharacterized protein n=1 Tax=Streptomyces cellostaticus TaxID=67285 RepID=A0A101NTC1_9ACTN|nr:hypothetical protein [Streptomyces cellostaticus]KUM98950.1 hypothetical protein AQI88_01535 [Streptomyces cellostaticus]GHI03224.1 hypothetical protein Scel_15450 [Streptomyces cellostaticus]
MSSTSQPVLRVRVTAQDAETLRALLRDARPDVGGRPRRADDGSCSIEAYATAEQATALEREGVSVTTIENATATGRARQAEVGKGDRFAPADAVPHGLAVKA